MKIVSIIFLMFFLSACGSKEIIKYVDKPVFVKTELRSELYNKCVVSQPPNKEKYINATDRDKEDMLTEYIITLHSDIKKCNNQIAAIEKTIKEQNDLIERKNNEKN